MKTRSKRGLVIPMRNVGSFGNHRLKSQRVDGFEQTRPSPVMWHGRTENSISLGILVVYCHLQANNLSCRISVLNLYRFS